MPRWIERVLVAMLFVVACLWFPERAARSSALTIPSCEVPVPTPPAPPIRDA